MLGVKANLIAWAGPDGCHAGRLGVSGHLDCVLEAHGWTSDPFVVREQSGPGNGRGVCDMKGFSLAINAFARLLRVPPDLWC